MTYVVTDNCIRCKFTNCAQVCPVEAFHEGNEGSEGYACFI